VNFLGHVFLNPDNDQLLVGNFIADSVKGDPYKKYPKEIADGIMLHRMIDGFTDAHAQVKLGVDRLRPSQGRWAPVVIDVIYDHVLASNWAQYHTTHLNDFVENVYARLEEQKEHFPSSVQRYFPYMKAQNWLYNYQYEWGLIKSLEGLDRRTSIETEMHLSVEVYRENERAFQSEFDSFISDAKERVAVYSGG